MEDITVKILLEAGVDHADAFVTSLLTLRYTHRHDRFFGVDYVIVGLILYRCILLPY